MLTHPARWALTPPFHPYPLPGGILSVALVLPRLYCPRYPSFQRDSLLCAVRTFLSVLPPRAVHRDCPLTAHPESLIYNAVVNHTSFLRKKFTEYLFSGRFLFDNRCRKCRNAVFSAADTNLLAVRQIIGQNTDFRTVCGTPA